MNTLKEIWFYLVTKLYFWLFESINVETVDSEAITHDFYIHGKRYKAISRETKYVMASIGRVAWTKEFSVYQVRMKQIGDGIYTEGWYPLLVPKYLKEMNFGHTQAVRVHWQRFYSYRKKIA